MERKCVREGGPIMTESESEDRERRRRGRSKVITMPNKNIVIVSLCCLLQCLLPTVLGQNDLVLTVQPSEDNFVQGLDYTVLCQLDTSQTGGFSGGSPLSWTSSAGSLPVDAYTVPSSVDVGALDTSETGGFSGGSPLSWTSSAGSLPQDAYTVPSSVDVGAGITSYKSRLNFRATPSLTNVQFTCSATIGTHTGSKVYQVNPIILKPSLPTLSGPTDVKAGDTHTWTCISSGASVEAPNVYYRNKAGNSITRTLSKTTTISIDAFSNLLYNVDTQLTTSLPPEDAQFILRCITVHEIGQYSDQKESTLTITVRFPPQLTKDSGDNVATTQNVRTTISCNIAASSPEATSVSWTKDGNPLFIDPTIYEGGTVALPSLIIKSAQESDKGDYVCSVVNSEGTGTFNNPTSLIVRYTAKFDYPDGTTFTGGATTTYTLPCNARAVPDPTTIRWKRVLNGFTSTIRINQEPRYTGGDAFNKNYGLTISNLEPSDADGEYFCEVDNDVGSSTSPRLTIVVNDRPTVTSSTTPSITVSENTQFVLSCVVQPLNTLTDLRWEKDGVTLDTTPATNQISQKYFGGNTLNPSLTIRAATDTDAGNYVCVATNVYGSTFGSTISVTLLFKPRVQVSPQPITSNGGGSIFLTCAVNANPAATLVYWNKDGARIDSAANPTKYSGGTTNTPPLIIFNSESSDSGDYFCIAQNDQGTTFSNAVTVSVSNIPSVSITPTTAVIPEGTISYTFTCSVTSNPTATDLYWTFNGVTLTTTSSSKYLGGTLATPSLTIRNVDRDDDGIYVCVALNSKGQGSSPTADLSVTYLPTITTTTTTIGKQVGTFVTIDCAISANPAINSLSWLKNGVTINTGDPTKFQGGTVGNPSLTIFKLETSDTGLYSCQAVNSRGTSTSQQVALSVSSRPSIEDPPSTVNAVEGQPAVLPCVVTPLNTLTSIIWTRDGIILDTPNPARYNGGTTTTPTLTILSTASSDVGSYRCTAVNEYGTGTGSAIALVLSYKPRLTVPSTQITEDAGRNILITCSIDANPNPTLVYWRKDGASTQLSADTNPAKYSGGTIASPSLTIISPEISDTGSYACIAINDVGSSISSNVAVSVVAIPSVTGPTNTDLTANEGDTNKLLTCIFEANPAPSDFYWTKDGSRLDVAGQPGKYSGGTSANPNLVIRTIQASDNGQYVCNVVNTKGTGTSPRIQLTVSYKPILTVPVAPITLNSGGAVLLSCSIDANPAVTQVYWTKDSSSTQLTSSNQPSKYGGGTVAVPSLTVFQTDLNDGGEYFCVAVNNRGTSISSGVQLVVEGTPTVNVGNSNPTATEGNTNLVLQCGFQANPAPTDLYWTKDGSRLDPSSQSSKYLGGTISVPSLTIRTVEAGDRGQYVCHVVNSKGTGSSSPSTLTVRYKPILSVTSTPITDNAGSNVVLSCTVDANPPVNQIYWTKDGGSTQLSSVSNPSKYGGGSAIRPSLTILSASVTDSGAYDCNAVNNVGLTTSNSVSVQIEGQPSVNVGNTNPIATEGDTNLVLTCSFLANPAPNDFYWTKDGSRLNPGNQPSKYSGGTIDLPDLTIRAVEAGDRGQYVCHVVNDKGTGSSPSIQLDVRYKPILTVPTTPISVPAATPLTLTCTVDSNPAPSSVYWTVFGQILNTASNPTKYNGGTVAEPNLSIVTSDLIDSGDYRCVVTNSVGGTTSSVVSVSFTSIPRVTATVPATAIPEGSVNVGLSCDFSSVPSSSALYWTKDGSRISASSQPTKYSGGTLNTPTLTILTIDYTDGGSYVCNVQNSIGTGSSSGEDLNVTYKPRLTVSNSAITSSPGTTVTLACQIDANPAPSQVYWTRGGVTVDSASNPTKYRGGTRNNPTLSILSSSFSDGDNYACVAVNSVGLTVSQDVVVSITNVPVVTVTPPSITVASGTSSLQLSCSHISNPFATNLFWTKDGVGLDRATDPGKYTGGTLASTNLIITNIDKSDRGTYVCNVVNSLGTGVSSGSVVDVTFQPDIVVPSTPVSGSTGSPITLPCNVDSNPSPTSLYWTKDGVRIVPVNTPGKYSGGTLSTPGLTILSPTFGDTGSYSCVVGNSIGSTTSGSVPVNIISIPSVTASLSVSTVREGVTNIIFTCNYQANPAATDLYWSKDGTRINSATQPNKYSGGTLDSTPNLTVRTVERTDKGTYICHVTNAQGTGASLGQALDVTYQPSVRVTDTPIVSEPGTSVILSCTVTANPSASDVFWIKTGGSRVGSNTNPTKYQGGTLSTPTLTILNTGISDTGSYSCVAINSVGTTTSDEVSVGIVDVPTVTSTSTVSTVPEGATNIIFTCSLTSNPSPSRLFWTRNNQEIDVANQPDKYGGGNLQTPSLTIKTVDRNDRGDYVCRVVNERGVGKSNPNSLDVTFKPTITTGSGNVRGERGQQVTLTCGIEANPALTVLFWTKNGVQFNLAVPAGKFTGGTIAEPDLTISNLDESFDPATYRCTASNQRGTTIGDPVELGVTFDPVVNIGGDVTANEGDTNVVIQCDVQMFPAATSVTWFKDGAVLQVSTNPSTYSGGTTITPSLTIRTLATTDAGVYQCSANNGEATKSSQTATLSVTYAPKIQTQNPVEASVGTTVTLPCVVDANPAATSVEWKRSDLTSGSSVRTTVTAGSRFTGGTVSTPSLTISSITVGDTAKYYCIVTNSRGTVEGSVEFRTKYEPRSVTATANPTSLTEGSQFVLTCTADAYPSPSGYAWYRGTSNTPISTSATYTKNQAVPLDNTNFRCLVSNAEGSATNGVNLDVRFAPISNRQGRTSISGISGSIRTLTCDISANPAPTTFTWYKGSSILFNEQSQTLTVPLNSDTDFGDYSCTATNAIGTMSPVQEFTITDGGPVVGASTSDDGLSTTTIVLIVIIIIIVLIILILIIIFCCLQGTCAKCCGKKDNSKVAPAAKTPLPPIYSNGGYFGPVVTPQANGKLKLHDDDDMVSPRVAGAGPIISVPETRGPRAHHLPPLSLDPTATETPPKEEKRRSRRKKRRRRGEDENHLTGERGEGEVVVSNVYSNTNHNTPMYEEI